MSLGSMSELPAVSSSPSFSALLGLAGQELIAQRHLALLRGWFSRFRRITSSASAVCKCFLALPMACSMTETFSAIAVSNTPPRKPSIVKRCSIIAWRKSSSTLWNARVARVSRAPVDGAVAGFRVYSLRREYTDIASSPLCDFTE